MTTAAPQRLAYIDAAKACGICCVAAGHRLSGGGSLGELALQAFHIPLFFFLAGLTLSPQRAQYGPAASLRNGLYRLGIPYLFFGLLSWALWLVLQAPARSGLDAVQASAPLWRMLYGVSGAQAWFAHNQTLWFFTCLVSTQVLFAVVFQLCRQRRIRCALAACALAAAVVSLAPLLALRLPWNLDVACVALGFYALGHALREPLARWSPSLWQALLVGGCGVVGVVLAARFNLRVDLNAFVFGQPLWFACGAGAGIALSLALAKRLPAWPLLALIGEASIVIFPLHVLLPWLGLERVFSVCAWYAERLLHSTLAAAFVVAALQLLLCLPPYLALRRWAPTLIGRPPRAAASPAPG